MNLLPPSDKSFLFLNLDTADKTTDCAKISRNISRDELISIIPASWVTKYEELRAYPKPLKPTDDSDHHHLKKPLKTTFYIPMYNPCNDISNVKDPAILKFFTGFMRQHDWININHEGRTLMGKKCLISGHYPWKTDYDCRIYKQKAATATQFEMLMMSFPKFGHTNAYILEYQSAKNNLT
ncbi:hypothetical protein FXO37_33628 [Capsicum annuum]|nr:hypothetical protein FXO37_33628 [Capsicum annuum]